MSPFITAIDKAVIHLACGRETSLWRAFVLELKNTSHPRRVLSKRYNDCIMNIILVKPNHISHHSSTAVMEKVPKEVVPVR